MLNFEIMPTLMKRALWPLCLAGFSLWGLLLYSNTFQAPFVFDDELFISQNPSIRDITHGSLWEGLVNHRRIVGFLSFALNYRLHGTTVEGYHWVNLGIHVANSFLVVWLIQLLFQTDRMRRHPLVDHRHSIAFLIGWLFLSHPIQTQAVTYISQRFESLAAFFYMLSICGYLTARVGSKLLVQRLEFFCLSIVFAFFGLFTKETVFTLPLALVVIEWLFFPPSKNDSDKIRWIWIVLFFFLCTAVTYVFAFHISRVLSQFDPLGITSQRYFFTQFGVIVSYIRLLFLPLNQNLDYNYPLGSGAPDLPTLLNLSGLLLILAAALRLRSHQPLISLGILWFFITLSASSSIIPLRDMMVEHRLYLPSVGFALTVVTALFSYLRARHLRIGVSILCGVILVFSFMTYDRNDLWTNEVALWEDVASKSPPSPRIYNNLGEAYRKIENYENAIKHYETALNSGPINATMASKIYSNMGTAYGKLGDSGKEIVYLLKAVALQPIKNSHAHNNLAYAYIREGDYEKALHYAWNSVGIDPRFSAGWNNIGVSYLNLGRPEKALEYFERALKVDPELKEAEKNLIRTRLLVEKIRAARK